MPMTNVKNLGWLAPFACISLFVVALLRPLPVTPPPAQSRTVVDASGTAVQVAEPFRGVALIWAARLDQYLHDTHAPESLIHAGGSSARAFFSNYPESWVYPQLQTDSTRWDETKIGYSSGLHGEIESMYAYDPGAYIGSLYGLLPLLRRIGLPALSWDSNAPTFDERYYALVRMEASLIERPAQGELAIANYRQLFADLRKELQPNAIVHQRTALIMGVRPRSHEFNIFVERAGIDNTADGNGSGDAERILMMDPEIIFFIRQESVQDFMRDVRFRDMKAVKEKRVYKMPGALPGYFGDVRLQPFWTRWMAEIAYPERLQPKLREMLREHFLEEFAYRLSDDQIDGLLHMDENKDQPGYERFNRNAQANIGQSALQ